MTLGKKLQMMRKQKGLSQENLASMITVSRQAVSKWESDETTPDIGNLIQLSKTFEVSLDFLLNDEIENSEETPAIISVVKKEKKKWNCIWIFILIVAIAATLCIAEQFHITTLVSAYLLLLAQAFLIIMFIVFLFKFIKFFEKRK